MAPSRTHYDVLGIAADADDAEIRRAWKVLVQVWHPDRFTGEMREHAEGHAQHINEAYGTLRDADKRSAYDRRLAYEAGETETSSRASASPRGPFGSAAAARPSMAYGAGARARTGGGNGTRAVQAPAGPKPFGEAAGELGASLVEAIRHNPRIAVACVSIWVLLVGGSMLNSLLSGPHVPADLAQREAVAAHTQRVSANEGPDPLAAFDQASASEGGATTTTPAIPDGAINGDTSASAAPGAQRDSAVADAAPRVTKPNPQPRTPRTRQAAPAPARADVPVDQGPALTPGHHKVIRILPQIAR